MIIVQPAIRLRAWALDLEEFLLSNTKNGKHPFYFTRSACLRLTGRFSHLMFLFYVAVMFSRWFPTIELTN
jgi:hypothetical protein